MLVRSKMSSDEDFISQVCNAFKNAVERASGVTLEGREREFRRVLTDRLFDRVLGWDGHSKVGEIYDIACFDDEDFPIIITETKWNVELTSEIKEKLRTRIEELGSVKYGVFASEREFIVYVYEDYELREITKINVAELVGVARKDFGLAEVGKRRVLKLEQLKRERLVWIEDPDYFEKTHKEISVAKKEGVELLAKNLKDVIRDSTRVLMNFFDSYWKRKDHYSGSFLRSTFNDWLRLSMKDEDFKKGNENERSKIVEVFCRETAYVLLGKILFTRICEDKDITNLNISGKGLAESLLYYERRRKKPYLLIFNESREEIRRYYAHLYELGYFDWWWVSPEKIGVLRYEDKRIQDNLGEDLNESIKKMFRRFNRFDFTQVNRDILGDVYQGYLPPNERKRLGEFYTPKEVIEYILDNVGYRPENEIRGNKILDPACGSGSFLVEAMQRLVERYRRIGFNFKDPDDSKQIIEECVNSIYGLDIHPFACFIAEINLLFQLVDLYDAVRQKDKFYELPRLNIYRTDSLTSLDEPIELAEFFDNSRRVKLVEETKGANKVKSIKFEYVVGNPPYVRKERIPTEYKEKILAKTYSEVYNGDNDICVYFIAKGIDWLNDGGRFGYIVSGKFTKTRYGRKLRQYIPSTCRMEQFVDLRGLKVFREVTNDPIILILNKEPDAEKRNYQQVTVVKVNKEKESSGELISYVKTKIVEKSFSDEYVNVFITKQSLLGKEAWKVVPIKYYELFEKIKDSANYSLSKLCEVTRGIETGRNVSKDGKPVFVFDSDKELSPNLERKLIKPLVKGADVTRWLTNHKGRWIIYTAQCRDGNELETNYPNVFEHLFKYRDELVYRHKNGKDSYPEGRASQLMKHREWYELRKPLSPEILEVQKILTRRITNEHLFAYDNKNLYPLETCCVIVPKKKRISLIKYITGLLNSKIIEFAIKLTSRYLGKQGYEYEKQYLDRLPIKLPQIDEEDRIAEEITNTVDQILQFYGTVYSIKNKILNFPKSYFEVEWSFDKLANVIKAQSLSKSSYVISEKSLRTQYLRDLDGEEVFRIILMSNEYIDFYSEEVASYVLEVLKTMNRITKRELLELKILGQPHLESLMGQYRKDRGQIVKNEETVKELEKQLNDLVYKLYDIAYKERRIIEEYLTKF